MLIKRISHGLLKMDMQTSREERKEAKREAVGSTRGGEAGDKIMT